MTKLEQLIKELCPNGVEYKKLSDIATVARGVRVVRDQLAETGDIPVYQNSIKPLGYHDKSNVKAYSAFVIGAGAAGEIGFSDVDFWAADDCYYFLCPDNLNNRYLYFVLMKNQPLILSRVRKASIPRLSRTVIENLVIPVPPLEVQAEIVKILDNFTELTAELTARKKQYEYYRDLLLDFGVHGGGTSECEWRTLGEMFPFIRNGFVGTVTPFYTDKENGVRYLQGTNIHNGVISDNEVFYITKEFHEKHKKNELQSDDILMVQSGHVGECAVVGEKYKGSNCHALIILSNGGQCDSNYVRYYLQSTHGKRILVRITTGGTVKHILASKMKNVVIPFPPIEEQKRIVSTLDRFDKLCNDISEGLPAEIEARRKQYEYYRDRLLSFEERKNA